MEATTRSERSANAGSGSAARKALTIGAVAKILGREFDDISISKIRYLEDQKLLSPRRTPGGYRLYSQADVERLREILRMQRDEFLPLRVIRQELASGGDRKDARGGSASVRRAGSVDGASGSRVDLEQLVDQTGLAPDLIRELEEYRFGVAGRNLRVLRTSADREAALLEHVVGPALRSSNQTRRREAIENLETLASTCSNLARLLLVRDLRKLTGE